MPALRPVLLLTRPLASAQRFARLLPEGTVVVISPLIEIKPLVQGLDFSLARGIVFTSGNAVTVAAGLTTDRALPCFCVGEATAQAARAAGWQAQALGGDADSLVAALLNRPVAGPLVHLSGEHRRGQVAERLNAGGIQTRVIAVYAQRLLELTPEARAVLEGKAPVVVPLFSPRTARHFAEIAAAGAPIHVVAMSDAVAEPLNGKGFAAISVVTAPDAGAMVQGVTDCLVRLSRVEGNGPAQ